MADRDHIGESNEKMGKTGIRERLQIELEEALAEIKRLDERLEKKGDYGLGEGDPTIYDWELCLALRRRAEQRVASISAALEKAQKGDYGVCEVCGQEIDPARLAVLPDTTLCIRCAQGMRS